MHEELLELLGTMVLSPLLAMEWVPVTYSSQCIDLCGGCGK